MQTASSFNTSPDTAAALSHAYADLENKLGGAPTWMAVHCTEQHPGEVIVATLQNIAPGVPFQGGTSCLGLMTETGFHSENGMALGLFGIRDPEGTYGTGYAEIETYPRWAGQDAILNALRSAAKDTPPAVVWITCPPGNEEEILAGISEGLGGANAPIIGGSSADNAVEGRWYQITNGTVMRNGITITAMYPSKRIHYAFDNSYTPTAQQGIITSVSGRDVHEINHRPAAEIYNEWTGGVITDYMGGGNILAPSTLYPLGREAEWTRGLTFFQLSHPEAVLEDGSIKLFTNAANGDTVCLMENSVEGLVSRVDRVTSKALASISDPQTQVAGALIIYCAGCLMAVQQEVETVVNGFQAALNGQPFLGIHTFGEQGSAVLGDTVHANLMMSIIVFEH